jgi:hypothetical protein
MSLQKGTKIARGYATVVQDDGVNYREIAETMTELGFTMNHSSARNYVLRIMKKFAAAVSSSYGADLEEKHLEVISRSPMFQLGIAEVLQDIEHERRSVRDTYAHVLNTQGPQPTTNQTV